MKKRKGNSVQLRKLTTCHTERRNPGVGPTDSLALTRPISPTPRLIEPYHLDNNLDNKLSVKQTNQYIY